MAGKVLNMAAEIVLADGLVILPAEVLQGLPFKDYARNGVVLANERTKAMIFHGEGENRIPVEYTVSIYVQRAALDEEEAKGVAAKAADGDFKKRQRTDDDTAKKEREVMRAFELGQSSTLTNLNNIGTLTAAANVLRNNMR